METSSAPLIVFYRVCSRCETRVLRSVDIQVESRAIAKQTLESRSNISILHATHARHHDRQIYIDCRVTACWHSDEGRFVTLLPAVETGLLQKGCRSARLHSAAVCPFSCVHALARSVKMCSRALCPRQTGDTNTGLSRLSLTIIAGQRSTTHNAERSLNIPPPLLSTRGQREEDSHSRLSRESAVVAVWRALNT